MKQVLDSLYDLYIKKKEARFLSPDEEIEKEKELNAYEMLYKTLSNDQKKLFDPLTDLIDNLHDNEEERAYKDGFIAGASLMIEIFSKE